MNWDVAVVLLAAVTAANLPFLTERLFCVWEPSGGKPWAARLGELIVYYFVCGSLALALEARAGQIQTQGWEFYAITASLFLTFAFPGFVWRYLWRR